VELENKTYTVQAKASLNLYANVTDPERFARLIHPFTAIDVKVSVLSCEGVTYQLDGELLKVEWEVFDEDGNPIDELLVK
jgi:hypothetical protein